MRALQLDEPRHFQRVEINEPASPRHGEVLVRSHRMGVCGTDVSSYLGKFPFFDYPRIPGHELGVEVLEIGSGVDNVKIGDRCSVEPYMNCGTCYACRQGATNCCATLSVIGVMTDGGLCDRFRIRADKLHPGNTLSFEQLALVETLAIGCHANDRGNPAAGEQALIVGAGPIGMATLEFVRIAGVDLTIMDRVESRLDFCRMTYGIEKTILFTGDGSELQQMQEITGGVMFATVFDATGSKDSMSNALRFVAPTGTLVFVGLTADEISFKQPVMHKPELTLKATRNALPENFKRIIRLIEAGAIRTDPWITHRTGFEQVAADFEIFTNPESGVIKAIIDLS